ncbi:MAG: hypothetical protein OEX12_15680 [Gammaproteobacteria bacterium]|nr:hypothetical protein [Gammaproteobacteria bacterium]
MLFIPSARIASIETITDDSDVVSGRIESVVMDEMYVGRVVEESNRIMRDVVVRIFGPANVLGWRRLMARD